MHWQLFGPLVVVVGVGLVGPAVVLCVVGTVAVTIMSNDVVGTVTIGRAVVLSSHVGQYTGQAIGAGGGFGVALQLLVHSLG